MDANDTTIDATNDTTNTNAPPPKQIPAVVTAERDEFVASIKVAATARQPIIDGELVKAAADQVLLASTENPNKYQEARRCIDAYNIGLSRFPCAKVIICVCKGARPGNVSRVPDDWRNVKLYIRSDKMPGFIIANIAATSIGTCLVDPKLEEQAAKASAIMHQHITAPCKFVWSDYASTGSVPSLQRIREKYYSRTFDNALRPVVLTSSVRTTDIICGYYVRRFEYKYVLEVTEGYGITTVYAFNDEDISWDPIDESDLFPTQQTEVDKMVVDAIQKFNHDGVHFEPPSGVVRIRAQGDLDCNMCIDKYTLAGTDNNQPTTKYCSACGQLKYCSADCQRADWANHKKICSSFAIKK